MHRKFRSGILQSINAVSINMQLLDSGGLFSPWWRMLVKIVCWRKTCMLLNSIMVNKQHLHHVCWYFNNTQKRFHRTPYQRMAKFEVSGPILNFSKTANGHGPSPNRQNSNRRMASQNFIFSSPQRLLTTNPNSI